MLIDLVHLLSWKILLLRAECFIEILDQPTICILHQFLAKKTRNRLGFPEEALFDALQEIVREERPPNAVVVYPK